MNDSRIITFKDKRLAYASDFRNLLQNDIIVSFRIPLYLKKKHEWIDLDSLTREGNADLANHFIAFIRRYGTTVTSK